MHSPEPWKRHTHETIKTEAIYDCNEKCVVDAAWYENHVENADRIVACVNFCRQLPTKFLECMQAVNLQTSFGPIDNPDRQNNLDDAQKSLADVERFCGLIAIQRNE